MGRPVLRTLSLCTCCRHYPGAAAGRTLRSASPSRISLPRKGCRVGLRIVLFEDCSAFTRVTACTLALSPIRDTLTRGFSHFVTSMTAPVASGWSGCRVGLAPTGKRRLARRTGHATISNCYFRRSLSVTLRRQRSYVRIALGAPLAYKTTNISVRVLFAGDKPPAERLYYR